MRKTVIEDNVLKDQLLQVMIDNEWSDMYITVGAFPSIKISEPDGCSIRMQESGFTE